jgi:archaellum component FlaC
MSEAIQLDDPVEDYIDESRRSDSYSSRAVPRKSGGSGGNMDDVLKRLGAVESSVSELRVQVSGIAATMATKDELNRLQAQVSGIAATMATKDELNRLQAQVGGIAATIPYLATNEALNEIKATLPSLATKADVKADILTLRADMYAMETKIIKWMIATTLTSVGLATGLAFSIAKLVH